jgi:mitochondrial fission protein ELM1
MDRNTPGPDEAESRDRVARSGIVILLLQDGKAGHENQAMALIEALQRRLPLEVHPIAVPARRAGPLRLLGAWAQAHRSPRPDLVLGAGHATHGALLLLAALHRVPSLVLMRPSLPMRWFSRVVVPSHDVIGRRLSPRVIETLGPLCRRRAPAPAAAARRPATLVLIGGPSRHHLWDPVSLRKNLAALLAADPDPSRWCLVSSRRTPAGSLEQLARALDLPQEQLMPWRHCPAGWLAAALARRPQVWVTEDSLSMLFEAVSAGARVGLLPVPRRRRRTRQQASLDRLVSEGYVLPMAAWRPGRCLPPPPAELREADRVADLLLPWLRPMTAGRAASGMGS